MSHFDAIRWSDCLPPALGGLRFQDSHARNIVGPRLRLMPSQKSLEEEGTLAVSDGKL